MAKTLYIITGPTAVGKTELCLALAEALNCHIFSADSRQLYREMTIGTAKPTPEELARVPHHFIDHISITDDYSVGRYEAEAIAALEDYFAEHDSAILTGGTGLYLKAITQGLDDFPPVPKAITVHYEQLFESEGLDPLQMELERRDRAYFDEVDLSNSRRLIRALSLIEATGQAFSALRMGQRKTRPFDIKTLVLLREREHLYQRINDRVDQMIRQGLLAEARELYPHRHLRSLDTVGYAELFLHFDGLVDQWGAIGLIKRNSRRYAKRQLTWFRNQMGDSPTLDLDASSDPLADAMQLLGL